MHLIIKIAEPNNVVDKSPPKSLKIQDASRPLLPHLALFMRQERQSAAIGSDASAPISPEDVASISPEEQEALREEIKALYTLIVKGEKLVLDSQHSPSSLHLSDNDSILILPRKSHNLSKLLDPISTKQPSPTVYDVQRATKAPTSLPASSAIVRPAQENEEENGAEGFIHELLQAMQGAPGGPGGPAAARLAQVEALASSLLSRVAGGGATGPVAPPPSSIPQGMTEAQFERALDEIIASLPVEDSLMSVITDAGFSLEQARSALLLQRNNVEQAFEYLLENSERPLSLDQKRVICQRYAPERIPTSAPASAPPPQQPQQQQSAPAQTPEDLFVQRMTGEGYPEASLRRAFREGAGDQDMAMAILMSEQEEYDQEEEEDDDDDDEEEGMEDEGEYYDEEEEDEEEQEDHDHHGHHHNSGNQHNQSSSSRMEDLD